MEKKQKEKDLPRLIIKIYRGRKLLRRVFVDDPRGGICKTYNEIAQEHGTGCRAIPA